MKLTYIENIPKSKIETIEFKGYNHNPVIEDGSFYDMKNLSGRLYPLLTTRKARGTVRSLTKANGLFAHNKLAYVDGTGFYYDGVLKGSVADSEKQFVAIGAYILIFPDKKYYNTSSGEFGSLEASYVGTAGQISFTTNSIVTTGAAFPFKKYDGVKIIGSSVEKNNSNAIIKAISVDGKTLTFADNLFTASSGGTITISREVPSMNYIVESENRVWGCSNDKHEIYASKLGDPFNFNCFEGISTDSYAVTIGSPGNFTGAIKHLGYPLFFKEDIIHKIYGSKPSNYQVISTNVRGVANGCEKSLTLLNETLYYMSRNGIVAYEGSVPVSVADALGKELYINAIAGNLGNLYYVCLKNSSNAYSLFVYDESKGMWFKEDNTQVKYFARMEGTLYYIDNNNKLRTIEGTDTDVIDWFADTGEITLYTTDNKYITKLNVEIELEAGSWFEISIDYDSFGIFEKVYEITSGNRRTYHIPIVPRRCHHFRIKISGCGSMKLFALNKVIENGGDS